MFEWKKSAGKIYTLPVESIRPSPFQARTVFDEKELAGLAQSIRENGLLQPISVRKVEGGYELVAGERRLRACKLARMETIPAILCDCGDQRTAALGLLENIQREDLNPFEQAQGLRDILRASETLELVAVVGLPVRVDGALYNCAAVVCHGALLGLVPKTHLPNYAEFYELRHFTCRNAQRHTVRRVRPLRHGPAVPLPRNAGLLPRCGDLRGPLGPAAAEHPPCAGRGNGACQSLGK
jgi:hypothetical protein